MNATNFVYDDGGRSKYFKAKNVADCVTRAIAIVSGKDYKEVYDMVDKAECTGETGVLRNRYESKRQARRAKYDLCHLKDADAYEYEIIETGNNNQKKV